MNDLLCLEDSCGNLARVLPVFNKEKIQKQIEGHVVSKCKENEFKGTSVTNFRYMEEISDISWPLIYWKKCKAIKGLSVRILELRSFKFREGQHFLHLCLQQGCGDNLLVILK